MKILEAVRKDEIPAVTPGLGRAPNPDSVKIAERVVSLNGMALPVEFPTLRDAKTAAQSTRNPRSFFNRLGIRAIQRGTTVFFWKKEPE